jgi:hypothetical protein
MNKDVFEAIVNHFIDLSKKEMTDNINNKDDLANYVNNVLNATTFILARVGVSLYKSGMSIAKYKTSVLDGIPQHVTNNIELFLKKADDNKLTKESEDKL